LFQPIAGEGLTRSIIRGRMFSLCFEFPTKSFSIAIGSKSAAIVYAPVSAEIIENSPAFAPRSSTDFGFVSLTNFANIFFLDEKADFGIALDGDADRVFFFDENAETIPADYITCLIAEELLKKGEKVLYDLRSSWVVKEVIEKNKGKALMSRVGHAFIKEQMRKEKAIFAGELSGHFYFRDNFYTDSGVIAALKVIQLISEKGKKLSELIDPLDKYYASGEINSEVKNKEGMMKKLAKKYKKGKVSWLDGVRIDFDDWWFNVRPSNTEPLLRLNLEAKSLNLMEEKRDEVLGILRK